MAIFLRGHERRKDGKTNTYWSLVENGRCADGRVVQRQVLYLGKLTEAQELSWEKTAAQFDEQPPPGQALPGLATEGELQSREAGGDGGSPPAVPDRATTPVGCLLGGAESLEFAEAVGVLE